MSNLRVRVAISAATKEAVNVTVVDQSGRVFSVIWQRPVSMVDMPLQMNFSPSLTDVIENACRIQQAESPTVELLSAQLSAEAASSAAGRSSVVINPLDRDTSVIVESANLATQKLVAKFPENQPLADLVSELGRASLLPAEAAAAVEEIFGKLDPEPSVPFKSSQRWGRSSDLDRLGAVRVRVLSAMAGCRTAEEFEQLCSRIAGRTLDSLEQEFPEPSPGESTSSDEALPSNSDPTGDRKSVV